MKQQKLLVTGASGFVGYHLVRMAKDMGFVVHAAVRQSSKVADITACVDQFVYPDYSHVDALKLLLEEENYTYIIHAAALTKAKRTSDMFTVNVDYTLNLLTAAFSLANPPKHIHIVSSLAAIGPLKYDLSARITEASPYQPVTIYGQSKMRMEHLVHERFADRPISIFRPTAVYGPREKDIFMLLKTLNSGVDAYIGRKPQALSFIYVRDLADLLLNSLSRGAEHLAYYNVTDGQAYDRYRLADVFRKLTGKRLFRIHIPYVLVSLVARLAERGYRSSSKTPVIYPERLKELTAGSWACDTSKIKLDLHFRPQYDLEAGLTESLSWYKKHRWL